MMRHTKYSSWFQREPCTCPNWCLLKCCCGQKNLPTTHGATSNMPEPFFSCCYRWA